MQQRNEKQGAEDKSGDHEDRANISTRPYLADFLKRVEMRR
jgi:hypothetical protein